MSTASGNPPYVVEPSDHESSQAPEPHSGQPHEQIETSREDSLQSPYAPKPPHERAAARLHVVDNDQDKISPFIPRRRRSRKQPPARRPPHWCPNRVPVRRPRKWRSPV
jgi:hypothetical protein